MPVHLTILGSGSGGNCAYLETDQVRLLIDAGLSARQVNWVSIAGLQMATRAAVKIRNRHRAADATLYPTAEASSIEVRFDDPQRAVTPGQAAVFYDGDLVLGGGWIE